MRFRIVMQLVKIRSRGAFCLLSDLVQLQYNIFWKSCQEETAKKRELFATCKKKEKSAEVVTLDTISRHAHILDFDVLRVSRQVLEDNRLSGSLEFGVVLITGIDKERGNRSSWRD